MRRPLLSRATKLREWEVSCILFYILDTGSCVSGLCIRALELVYPPQFPPGFEAELSPSISARLWILPAASQPAASQPAALQPASSQPAASQPGASGIPSLGRQQPPAALQPASSQPASSQPAMGKRQGVKPLDNRHSPIYCFYFKNIFFIYEDRRLKIEDSWNTSPQIFNLQSSRLNIFLYFKNMFFIYEDRRLKIEDSWNTSPQIFNRQSSRLNIKNILKIKIVIYEDRRLKIEDLGGSVPGIFNLQSSILINKRFYF